MKPNPYHVSPETHREPNASHREANASDRPSVVKPRRVPPSPLRRVAGMAAIVAAVFAIGPGAVAWAMSRDRTAGPGQRFVTYDAEVSFFGFAVEPVTAQWLSLTTGPILLGVGVILMRPRSVKN